MCVWPPEWGTITYRVQKIIRFPRWCNLVLRCLMWTLVFTSAITEPYHDVFTDLANCLHEKRSVTSFLRACSIIPRRVRDLSDDQRFSVHHYSLNCVILPWISTPEFRFTIAGARSVLRVRRSRCRCLFRNLWVNLTKTFPLQNYNSCKQR